MFIYVFLWWAAHGWLPGAHPATLSTSSPQQDKEEDEMEKFMSWDKNGKMFPMSISFVSNILKMYDKILSWW